MAEEFKTPPEKLKVTGNIVDETLANLTDLSGFTKVNATLTTDGTLVVNGKTFNVVKMVYAP